MASSQDALVKWVSGRYPVHETMFIRCIAAMPILLLIAWRQGALGALLTPHWRGVWLRAIVMCTAYLAFILSIAAIPIADSVAVYFTMPFFVAGLSAPLLGERVRQHRWIAITVGFAGVIIANGITKGMFNPAVLLSLYSALGYAIGQIIGRRLTLHVTPTVIALHQNVVYFLAAIVMAAIFHWTGAATADSKILAFLTRPWGWPTPTDFLFLASLGALAAFAMVMFASAYKHAEASFVAPFEYTAMFWAVFYGMTIWGDVPDRFVIIGGGLVVCAGLYMLWMDRRPAPPSLDGIAGPSLDGAQSQRGLDALNAREARDA
jgi:drug/metabolite transporter (DMT)-like permease